MAEHKIFYFAYGSNMSASRMEKRVSTFSLRVAARIYGWELHFNKTAKDDPTRGYANIIPSNNKESVVEGVLYEVTPEAITILDRREGYPDHYGKEELEVILADGSTCKALVYIANPDKVNTGLTPDTKICPALTQWTRPLKPRVPHRYPRSLRQGDPTKKQKISKTFIFSHYITSEYLLFCFFISKKMVFNHPP